MAPLIIVCDLLGRCLLEIILEQALRAILRVHRIINVNVRTVITVFVVSLSRCCAIVTHLI